MVGEEGTRACPAYENGKERSERSRGGRFLRGEHEEAAGPTFSLSTFRPLPPFLPFPGSGQKRHAKRPQRRRPTERSSRTEGVSIVSFFTLPLSLSTAAAVLSQEGETCGREKGKVAALREVGGESLVSAGFRIIFARLV
ncbi:hypothetical protein MRX96_018277 [Rhipicephalus microplus]